MEQMESEPGKGHGGDPHEDKKLVPITVDGTERFVDKGKYSMPEFKQKVTIPADYEVDEVVNGEFIPIADDATIHIKGGEVYVSHVRRGGSS